MYALFNGWSDTLLMATLYRIDVGFSIIFCSHLFWLNHNIEINMIKKCLILRDNVQSETTLNGECGEIIKGGNQ